MKVSWISYCFSSFSCLLWFYIFFLYFFGGYNPGNYQVSLRDSMIVDRLSFSGSDGRLLIIGDVHGCEKELLQLVKSSNFNQNHDKLIFVGDMVGKGPYSQQVIQFAMDHDALCVRGNHEDVLLSWYHSLEDNRNTLLNPSYLEIAEQLTEDQWKYLDSCPLYLKLENPQDIIIVHAGIDPFKDLENQEDELLMNMRNHVSDEQIFTKDYYQGKPWINQWNGPELIVFGHDAKRGIQLKVDEDNIPIAIGLDSGVVYGEKLSALAIPDMKILQVPAKKMYKKP